MRSLNLPLRLLTENEIFRLSVWGNPTNDSKRGADIVGSTEKTLLDVSEAEEICPILCLCSSAKAAWSTIIRTLWRLDPAIVVHLAERFKNPSVRHEVGKTVRFNASDVLDVPEALSFLLGDRLDSAISRNLKVSRCIHQYSQETHIAIVSPAMGSCSSSHCEHILWAGI